MHDGDRAGGARDAGAVALVPRSLAHAAVRRAAAGMTALAVLVLAVMTGPVSASVDVDLAPYTEAQRAGAEGGLIGRAYSERPKPDAADAPLTGTTVWRCRARRRWYAASRRCGMVPGRR